ncbi:MAG: indolepyruvate oxidoreductase subunit beta [Candidatus Aenigmatarchaeota archaeon]
MKDFNLVIVGVGGQGILTLGNIVAEAAMKEGFDVKTSELHGLAQRGGPIPCHVRFGKKIYSSIVMEGDADLVIGLEPLEALRAAYYGSKKKKTVFVFDTWRIIPSSILTQKEAYPSLKEIQKDLKKFGSKAVSLNASDIAKKETERVVYTNVYLLGYCVGKKLIPLKKNSILEGMKSVVPEKYFETNKKVFELGMKK